MTEKKQINKLKINQTVYRFGKRLGKAIALYVNGNVEIKTPCGTQLHSVTTLRDYKGRKFTNYQYESM